MTGLGVVVGLGLAYSLSTLLQGLLFEVSPTAPLVYVGAGLGLAAAALIATALPAHRAASVSPVASLRAE